MIELYFNDANLMPENREEEQYAEAALNSILAGKTADVEMCIQPCFYDAPLHKGQRLFNFLIYIFWKRAYMVRFLLSVP